MWRMWVAALFWGLNWPAVKIVLDGVAPLTLRAVGLAGGAALIAMVALVRGNRLAVPRAHWRSLLVSSVLNVVCFNIFAVYAQMTLPTSRAAILTFTMPFWAALFAWVYLGERIDRLRIIALLLGAGGLVLLSVPFWPVLAAGELPIGLVHVLGAAITWAAGTVYMKRHPLPIEPIVATAWQVAIAAVVCALAMAAFETPRLELGDEAVRLALAYHIVFPQALSYVMWFGLIRTASASSASLGTLLIPIFGVGGAIVILGERPDPTDFAGFALILAGIGLDQGWRAWRAPSTPR